MRDDARLDSILVLTAENGLLAKRISSGMQVQGYDKAYSFTATDIELDDGLDDLGMAVAVLATMPRCCVVRGELTEFAKAELAEGRSIRRLLRDRPGAPATIVDAAKRWCMIDIDSHPISDIGELADDPDAVIGEMIRSYLPPAFHDATCWWQLSSTCGFVRDVAKAHLWFWLSEARTGAELKAWAEIHAQDIDASVFSPNQILYTANAQLDGITDPLALRGGWRYGEEETVSIPKPLPAAFRPRRPRPSGEGVRPQGGVCAALSAIGDGPGQGGFHAPLRRTAMVYARDVIQYGRPRDDDDQIVLMQSCIEVAPCRDGRRSRYLSEHYLADLIRSAFEVVARG